MGLSREEQIMLSVLEVASNGGAPNLMSAYTVQVDFQNRFPKEPKLSMEEAAEGIVLAVEKGFIELVGLEHLFSRNDVNHN